MKKLYIYIYIQFFKKIAYSLQYLCQVLSVQHSSIRNKKGREESRQFLSSNSRYEAEIWLIPLFHLDVLLIHLTSKMLFYACDFQKETFRGTMGIVTPEPNFNLGRDHFSCFDFVLSAFIQQIMYSFPDVLSLLRFQQSEYYVYRGSQLQFQIYIC